MENFFFGHLNPYDQKKIFSFVYVDFEKRVRFATFSHRKMAIMGFLAKRLLSLNFPLSAN
jgi:hypothetical protein